MQLKARGLELLHELMVVGGDNDGGAKAVKLNEQAQQAAGHLRVDVTGWFVSEQQLGLADYGAGDGGALLFTTGEDGGEGVHALSKSHPLQEVCDIFLIFAGLFAGDAQRQGDIFPGGEMIEQAKILKYDADAAAQIRPAGGGDAGHILAEEVDEATCRLDGHEKEAQQAGFTGTRGAGEEVQRAGAEVEVHIAQDFRASTIAERDIL